jgi:hypothetical protein
VLPLLYLVGVCHLVVVSTALPSLVVHVFALCAARLTVVVVTGRLLAHCAAFLTVVVVTAWLLALVAAIRVTMQMLALCAAYFMHSQHIASSQSSVRFVMLARVNHVGCVILSMYPLTAAVSARCAG